MSEEKKRTGFLNREIKRRDFLADQIKVFAAAALFPAPLASLLRIKPAGQETPGPEGGVKKAGGIKKNKKGPIHELAKSFVNEKLYYELSFLNVVDAGTAKITFEQDYGGGYVGTIVVKTTGAVKKLTKHREQTFTSRMKIVTVDGKPRFVSSIHARITIKEGKKVRTTHRFLGGKWYYMKFEDDKKVKSKKRKMKAPFYEDLVVAFYNFRAGAYGRPERGRKYTVATIPHKGVDSFQFKVASSDEMKKEKKWIGDHKSAKHMVIVEIDQKIFGAKRGEALLLSDEKLQPLAAKSRDVSGFGDVYMNRKK